MLPKTFNMMLPYIEQMIFKKIFLLARGGILSGVNLCGFGVCCGSQSVWGPSEVYQPACAWEMLLPGSHSPPLLLKIFPFSFPYRSLWRLGGWGVVKTSHLGPSALLSHSLNIVALRISVWIPIYWTKSLRWKLSEALLCGCICVSLGVTLLILCMWAFCLCVWLCNIYVPAAFRGQREVKSYELACRNQACNFHKSNQALFAPLHPTILSLLYSSQSQKKKIKELTHTNIHNHSTQEQRIRSPADSSATCGQGWCNGILSTHET